MITFTQKGDFEKTFKFLKKAEGITKKDVLNAYGIMGVAALRSATPVDSGSTASGWYYTISKTRKGDKITWRNSNINQGIPIAILIQYGHGTGTGGYVQGRDFINPAIQPVFDGFANDIWKELSEG